MKGAIGIDLGGTSVKYALLNKTGEFFFEGKLPSLAKRGRRVVLGEIIRAAREAQMAAKRLEVEVCGIGLGTPGIVDATGRIVLGGAENLPDWSSLPLADLLETAVELPVVLGNDANLMGLGETRYGAGHGYSDVVFLTVGTGIGGAIVIDGKLFTGFGGRGTELGHVPLIANGEPCACGSVGCLEHYASTSALVRRFCAGVDANTDVRHVNGESIVALYKAGDSWAVHCLEEHCDFLGHGISGFINIFAPQQVVIGGGLSEAGDFYITKVREAALRYAMSDCAFNTKIVAAKLGNKAGCLGASALAFDAFDEPV